MTPRDMPEKLLFTPGPITTSRIVKEAMLRDLGSRDAEFIEIVRGIRREVVRLAQAEEPGYVAIPMQGSGTFGVESVLGSVVTPEGKLLVLDNGAYGARLGAIARALRIPVEVLVSPEHERVQLAPVDAALERDPAITHVAAVHCETATGMVNPIDAIGRVVRARGRRFVVDAISSFGGIPLSVEDAAVDYLIASANKCLEGVPGFSLILARRAALDADRGQARGVSLDLAAQLDELERSGQFRFTPPTHALLACARALAELDAEGGVPRRAARYRKNQETLVAGMGRLGFRPFLRPEDQGPIITAFHDPRHARYAFSDFYERLSLRGFVIYPGKVSRADLFRIGTIGRVHPHDVTALLAAVAEVLAEMGVPVPMQGSAS